MVPTEIWFEAGSALGDPELGSFADAMPLRNESGDVTLVFSGEEFPERGTVAGLQARGYKVELRGPS